MKSPNMERLACERAIDELLGEGIPIGIYATDRHPQVIALVRKYVETGRIGRHSFDPYHVIKGGISKKISEAAKKSGMELLADWKESVINHAWWSLSECGGNAELARDLWISVIHHVVNEHIFQTKTIKRCMHEPLDESERKTKKWMKKDSAEHQALKEVLRFNFISRYCELILLKIALKPKLLADLMKCADFVHTGPAENFNSLRLKYCPKRTHFTKLGMEIRSMLAALDHNSNTGSKQRRVVIWEYRFN